MLKPLVTVAVIAALLSLGANASVPAWVMLVFAAAILLMFIPMTVERFRAENRLARTIWRALTGK